MRAIAWYQRNGCASHAFVLLPPGETLAASHKTATLREGFPVPSGASYPRVQIVLEGLGSTTLGCQVGLRIHVLTIDPKLDLSLLWLLKMEANQHQRERENALSRPPPPCTNPKHAKRRVYGMQQLARCWDVREGDGHVR